MGKTQIIVGTPSFNEEDNIGNVIKKIDTGLVKYFSDYKSLIVDVDESTDNTRNVFLKTKTINPKRFFYTGPNPGKGKNLLKLLEYAVEEGADYICTIDSDVTSIEESWTEKLLLPLINGAEFVSPLYSRNRYEGNTTNHFCVPIISAWFNSDIRQPIGGECAMSKNVAEYILTQKRNPETEKYGIDIFFMMHAIGNKFKTKEVYLGKKRHKPSFEKMVPMFQQVAATAFYVMSQYRYQNFFQKRSELAETSLEKQEGIDIHLKKPTREAIFRREKYAIKSLKTLLEDPKKDILPLNQDLLKNTLKEHHIKKELWVEILSKFVQYIKNKEISSLEATRLSSLISPFYLLRVLNYYEEIENLSPKKIENIIIYQRDLLKRKLNI